MSVSREARQAGREMQDVLQEADPATLGFSVLGLGGGAILGQEVAQQVLSLLGRPIDPVSGTDLGISGLSKTGLGLGLGALAVRMSGGGLVFWVMVMAAFGSLTSAGVDFFDMLQRAGLPGFQPQYQGQQGMNPHQGQQMQMQRRRASTDGGSDTSPPARSQQQQQTQARSYGGERAAYAD